MADGAASRFLGAVFENSSFNPASIEVRALTDKGPRTLMAQNLKQVEDFVTQWTGRRANVYFGVTLRRPMVAKGSAENCVEATCAWVDLDVDKQKLEGKKVQDALMGLMFKPTFIIHSGGGVHCYWLFREPLNIDPKTEEGRENVERLEQLNRQLSGMMAGDPVCHDVARILRIPGSANWKYEETGRRIYIAYPEADGPVIRYELSDLEDWASYQSPVLEAPLVEGRAAEAQNAWQAYGAKFDRSAPIDVASSLANMTHRSPGANNIHNTQLVVTGSLVNTGMADEDIIELVMQATMQCAMRANVQPYAWNWKTERRNIAKMVATAHQKYDPDIKSKLEATQLRAQASIASQAAAATADVRATSATISNLADVKAAIASGKRIPVAPPGIRLGSPGPAPVMSAEWPDPIPLEEITLVPWAKFKAVLTEDHAPPLLLDLAQKYHGIYGTDPVLSLVPMMTAIATSLGSNIQMANLKSMTNEKIRGASTMPHLWCALVSPSGGGKTSVINSAIEPLEWETITLRKQYEAERQAYKQMLAGRDKKDKSLPPDPPKERRIITNDMTTASLAKLLGSEDSCSYNGALLAHVDELSGFFKSFNEFKSGSQGADRERYLTLHAGKRVIIDRVKDGVTIIPPTAVSIIGGMTPSKAAKLKIGEAAEDGMNQRFMFFVFGESEDRSIRDGDVEGADELQKKYNAMIRNILHSHPPEITQLRISERGIDIFDHLLSMSKKLRLVYRDEDDGFIDTFTRYLQFAIKITLIYHAVDAWANNTSSVWHPISDQTILMACNFILGIAADHHRRFWLFENKTDVSRDLRMACYGIFKRVLHPTSNAYMLPSYFGRVSRRFVTKPANRAIVLDALQTAGWIRIERTAGTGDIYHLNPKIKTAFAEQLKAIVAQDEEAKNALGELSEDDGEEPKE